VVFFFQAEDGIRDKLVTGVQTCALPIYRRVAVAYRQVERLTSDGSQHNLALRVRGERVTGIAGRAAHERMAFPTASNVPEVSLEIGRASCRERGEISGGGVSV